MEPHSPAGRAPPTQPACSTSLRLETCPRCEYVLAGLPAEHHCPECGFAYDDRTFVLMGITRGTGGTRRGRKWLWALVVVLGWFGVWLGPILAITRWGFLLAPWVLIWVVAALALILTRRGGRNGIEAFAFTPAGFGACADLTPADPTDPHLVPWASVSRVVIDRKGPSWHRIRIGSATAKGRLTRVRFDAGVRCDEHAALWVHRVLTERIAASRAGQPGCCVPPDMRS